MNCGEMKLDQLGDGDIREGLIKNLIDSQAIYNPDTAVELIDWGKSNNIDSLPIDDQAGFAALIGLCGWACGLTEAAIEPATQAYLRGSTLGGLVILAVQAGMPFSEYALLYRYVEGHEPGTRRHQGRDPRLPR